MLKPKLSVIICTYNRAGNLRNCLISLCQQSFRNFEVVIVDGGSTDSTRKIIDSFASRLDIKFIINITPELAIARDHGWREAKGQIVSWIDDDVVASTGWAKSIVEIFVNNKNIGGVSGPTIVDKKLLKNRDVFFFYHHQNGIAKILGRFWNWFFLEGKMYAPGQLLKSGAWTPGSNFPECLKLKGLTDVDYLEACNMSIRKSLVAQVDGLDLGYRRISEWSELDLAVRVKKLGYRLVFSPQVKVAHNISQGGVFTRRTAARQRMENFFRFYFRHIFKPQFDYIIKLTSYVMFLNLYWTYKAIKERNFNWLSGWIGTITGFAKITRKSDIYMRRDNSFILYQETGDQ